MAISFYREFICFVCVCVEITVSSDLFDCRGSCLHIVSAVWESNKTSFLSAALAEFKF